VGELTEFVIFTLWESFESIKAFAGEEPEVAVFYPEDERFLVERDEFVTHYSVDQLDEP
jgi:heme-degrading monooxygenase HmoA